MAHVLTPNTPIVLQYAWLVWLAIKSAPGQIAEVVVQHLAVLLESKVVVTLEITADVPTGVPDHVVRTVTENCRTLKFTVHEFEDE